MAGMGISMHSNGRYKLRIYRKHTRYYLGMYATYEEALTVRQDFLNRTDNGALLEEPIPEPYSKRWFEENSKKQLEDFKNRYANL